MLLKLFILLSIFYSSNYLFYGCTETKNVNVLEEAVTTDNKGVLHSDYSNVPGGFKDDKCVSFFVLLNGNEYEIFFSRNDLNNIGNFLDENDKLSDNQEYYLKILDQQKLIFEQMSNGENKNPNLDVFKEKDGYFEDRDSFDKNKLIKNKLEISNVQGEQMKIYGG